MKTNNFLSVLALLACVACGGGGGGGGSNGSEGIQELVEATPGTYYSVLRPVNFYSNGYIPYGAATFTVKENQLQVSTSMDDDQAVAHRQSLHLGTRCPTAGDDTNGDGFVDYNEAIAVVGPALMPLDNDLSSQKAGAEIYPRGRGMTYNKSASLPQVNADLWVSDENPSDNVTKLAPGQALGFEERVVLVHGTSASVLLPNSLSSYPGEAAHLSLPVVCGVLKKID